MAVLRRALRAAWRTAVTLVVAAGLLLLTALGVGLMALIAGAAAGLAAVCLILLMLTITGTLP